MGSPGPADLKNGRRGPRATAGKGVPDGVHPLAHRALGGPHPQEGGDAEQQGQEQVRDEGLHLHSPAGLQQQLMEGPGGLRGGGSLSAAAPEPTRPTASPRGPLLSPGSAGPSGLLSV